MAGPWEKYAGGPARQGMVIADPFKANDDRRADAQLGLSAGNLAVSQANLGLSAQRQNATLPADIRRSNAEAELAEQKAAAGKVGGRFDDATTLRKELDGQPAVKAYINAMPSYAAALQSPDTPAGDLNLTYAFSKIMDPDSVVREGEQNAVAGLGSIGERIAGELRKQLGEGGRFSPEVRAQLRQTLRSRVAEYNRAYMAERARYRDLATQQGVDPKLIVGTHLGDSYARIENQYFNGDPNDNGQRRRDDAAVAAALKGVRGVGGTPGQPPAAGGSMGGAPAPQPMSPEDFQRGIQKMLSEGRPQAEIMQFVQQNGSTLNERDQGVLGQYEQARVAGLPTEVGVRVQPAESTLGGIVEGAYKPWDRAAAGLETGINKVFGTDLTQAHELMAGRTEAVEGIFGKTSEGGQALGTFLSTLPVAYAPGGAFTQGAVANTLASDSTSPSAIVKDALVGGLVGKAGDAAVKGVAGLIAPALDPAVTSLANQGVRLTPGRLVGGRLKAMEDRAASLPLAGPRIEESLRNSGRDWNTSLARQSLEPAGKTLPTGVEPGHESVASVADILSQGYNDVLPRISASLDPTFVTRSNAIRARAARDGLPQAQMDELETIFQRDVGGAFTPQRGSFGGREYKRLDERLGDIASSYGRSEDPYQRQLGGYVGKMGDQVGALVRRQNPAEAGVLRGLDASWARYSRLRDAASKNVETGLISPGNLRTAVRTGDKSAGKGATARGDAIFQDAASEASQVLPASIGNSGTADRLNQNDWKAWLAGSVVSPLYGEGTQAVIQSLLTSSRPAAAQPIAELLKSLPAGTVAPLLLPSPF